MVRGDKLLKEYIRPYVYELISVCSNETIHLVHAWQDKIEKNWKVIKQGDEEVFISAYFYLSGFSVRHEKEILNREDIKKEFERFFYLFKIALRDFDSLRGEILGILGVAVKKVKDDFKIPEFYNRYKSLLKKYKIETPKPINIKIDKESTPLEDKIKGDTWEGIILSSDEIIKIAKKWISDDVSDLKEVAAETKEKEPSKKEGTKKLFNMFGKKEGEAKEEEEKPLKKEGTEAKIKEEPLKKEGTKKEFNQKKTLNKFTKVLILIVLLIGLIIFLTFSNVTEEVVENVNKTKIVEVDQKTIPSEISFSEYIENPYEYDKEEVTLKGFLKRSIEGRGAAGVQIVSIVDDYDNEIKLEGEYTQLKIIIPEIGKTDTLYSVKGTFEREYRTLNLQTETITPTERDPARQIKVNRTVPYTETITKTITRPRFPLIREFVFNLVEKVKEKIS